MMVWQEIPPTAGLPMRWRDWWPTGESLPEKIATLFGLPPLQLECSGTASFIVALKTLIEICDDPDRNEVVIPAFSCPLVVLAIVSCGLKPRLCDIALGHFDFDQSCLEKSVGPQTLAIVPTHLGGQVADVAACVPLARAHNAYIIEDAAQALGAEVGRYGDIVFFSLAVGKGLTLFEGGLLTAQSESLRAALKQTHDALIPDKPLFEMRRIIELLGYTALYRPRLLPWVYGAPRRRALAKGNFLEAIGDEFDLDIPLHRVSPFRAKRGARAAQRLSDFLEKTHAQARARIAQLQMLGAGRFKILGAEAFQNAGDKKNVNDSAGRGATWPFLMVLMQDAASRDQALKKLWPSPYGVTRLFINALDSYGYLKPYMQGQPVMPNAADFSARMLTISNSLWLDQTRFDALCRML